MEKKLAVTDDSMIREHSKLDNFSTDSGEAIGANQGPIDLPFIKELAEGLTGRASSKMHFDLGLDQSQRLIQYAFAQESTCHALLLSVFLVVLRKLSGQNHLHIALSGIHGPGLSVSLEGARPLVNVVQDITRDSADYINRYAGEEAPEAKQPGSNVSYGFERSGQKGQSGSLSKDHLADGIALHLNIGMDAESIALQLTFNEHQLSYDSVLSISEYIRQVIEQLLTDDHKRLADMEMITDKDKSAILETFNNTDFEFPEDETVLVQFDRVAKQLPGNKAIQFEDEVLTFGELSKLSDQIGIYLRDQYGIEKGDIIIVHMDRSLALLPSILGLMKAGAVYLPVVRNTPEDRFISLIKDAEAKLIITDGTLLHFKEEHKCPVMDFKQSLPNIRKVVTDRFSPLPKGADLAYIIYTSGSTGKPKGVMIEHRALLNRINWMQQAYPISSADVLLQKTPLSFDVSIWELFWWSTVGASLVLLPQDAEKEPRKMVKYIEKQGVTVMHFVPSMLSTFLQAIKLYENHNLEPLRLVFSSGEALKASYVREFSAVLHARFSVRLINLYGPTEATVDVSYYECKLDGSEDVIPIGKPISNIKLLVLDQDMRLAPIGVKGQLVICGVGLARGYLNKEKLTAEKFVDLQAEEYPYRAYLTGDMAQWLPDGNIIYLGRTDDQVKISGYRIELGEIESQMLTYLSIQEAAVVVTSRGEHPTLKGFFVAESDIDPKKLSQFLSQHLPAYMVPYHLMQIEEVPLTGNGKCDRKKLAAMTHQKSPTQGYVKDDITRQLATIWSEILGASVQEVLDSGCFYDLGGHSLLAVQIIARVYVEFNVDLSLATFLKQDHISDLAKVIRQEQKNTSIDHTILPVFNANGRYPLSFSQGRMWAQAKIEGDTTYNNMVRAYKLHGHLEPLKFQQACQWVVNRHDSLRTIFEEHNGTAFQKIIAPENYELAFSFEDRRVEQDKESILTKEQQAYADYQFDLLNGPLVIFKLIQLDDEEFAILLTMHHIISDGWSMGVFFRELTQSYEQMIHGEELTLKELGIQYKDYAAATKRLIPVHREYWLNQFSGKLPYLELPTDFARPEKRTYVGEAVSFQLDPEIVLLVKETSKKCRVSQFIILLSAYYILLYKHSGQSDLIIGTPIAGRFQVALEDQIGLYLNTLALRARFEPDISVGELFELVNQMVIDANEHQIYPFDLLLEDIGLERKANRSPLFDIGISWQSHEERDSTIEGITIKQLEPNGTFTPHDLWLIGTPNEQDATFEFLLIYNIALYKAETVETLKANFIEIVEQIATNQNLSVDETIMKMLEPAQALAQGHQQLSDDF